jgi:PAS domain S-box-containing protein
MPRRRVRQPLLKAGMKRSSNLNLIFFFTVLTIIMTTVVVFAWERLLRDSFFTWVERQYPGEGRRELRRDIQQRVEHFTISITVDVVVVTLLLRIVKRQQHKLVESEGRYRALFENALAGIGVVTAADRCLIDANDLFCETLGRPRQELVGHDVGEIIRPPAGAVAPPNVMNEMLNGQASGEGELVIERADGSPVPIVLSFKTFNTETGSLIAVAIHDLLERNQLETEKEEMQRQLIQASRLASLGELSAGVAHEINNPLNGIINFAQLLKDEEVKRSDFEQQMIDGIIDEGGRIAQIVRGLLTFARHDPHRPQRVQLAEAVKTSLSLLGRQFETDGIEVEVDVPDDLPPLRADSTHLRQVVLNIISNAHHALKMKQSEAAQEKLFRIRARHTEGVGRSLVSIEFYDNGVGIRREDLSKVFDPFFTTRRDAGGTGLGLSVSFGIVHNHGGTIRVESEEGCFSRFIVEFPADEEDTHA